MKNNTKPLCWIVKIFDFNRNAIIDYDVLSYKEDFIRNLHKKKMAKDEFADALRHEMMYHFWSRSQYELILRFSENRIILSPWCGSRNPKDAEIDVTEQTEMDWKALAEFCDNKMYNGEIKIDVWDQINFKFDEFVTLCWEYK